MLETVIQEVKEPKIEKSEMEIKDVLLQLDLSSPNVCYQWN